MYIIYFSYKYFLFGNDNDYRFNKKYLIINNIIIENPQYSVNRCMIINDSKINISIRDRYSIDFSNNIVSSNYDNVVVRLSDGENRAIVNNVEIDIFMIPVKTKYESYHNILDYDILSYENKFKLIKYAYDMNRMKVINTNKCSHSFCPSCVRKYAIDELIKYPFVIKCMDYDCNYILEFDELSLDRIKGDTIVKIDTTILNRIIAIHKDIIDLYTNILTDMIIDCSKYNMYDPKCCNICKSINTYSVAHNKFFTCCNCNSINCYECKSHIEVCNCINKIHGYELIMNCDINVTIDKHKNGNELSKLLYSKTCPNCNSIVNNKSNSMISNYLISNYLICNICSYEFCCVCNINLGNEKLRLYHKCISYDCMYEQFKKEELVLSEKFININNIIMYNDNKLVYEVIDFDHNSNKQIIKNLICTNNHIHGFNFNRLIRKFLCVICNEPSI